MKKLLTAFGIDVVAVAFILWVIANTTSEALVLVSYGLLVSIGLDFVWDIINFNNNK